MCEIITIGNLIHKNHRHKSKIFQLIGAQTVYAFLSKELPQVTALPLEGTYLMWLDCRAARHEGEPFEGVSERFADHLRHHAKLVLSTGTIYGADAEGFERLNIACPRATLLEGLRRLKEGFLSY